MPKIMINPDLCNKCYTCVQICPAGIFIQKDKDSIPKVLGSIAEDFCISCGHCAAICPKQAIIHESFPEGSINPVCQELNLSAEQVLEMIRTMRSIREFRDKPIEKETIERIIDGAHFAPSSTNSQSTEFVVVSNKAVLKKIVELTSLFLTKTAKQLRNPVIMALFRLVARNNAEDALSILPKIDRYVDAFKNGEDKILYNAPLLLVFHGKKSIPLSDVNANLALHNASLVSRGLGLGSFYAGFVVEASHRDSKIPSILSIPKNNRIYGALVLGYPKFTYKNWIERRPPKVKWI